MKDGGLLVPGDDRPDACGVLQRQHQAGGVLTVPAERGLDPDALEPFDDSFVDLHLRGFRGQRNAEIETIVDFGGG